MLRQSPLVLLLLLRAATASPSPVGDSSALAPRDGTPWLSSDAFAVTSNLQSLSDSNFGPGHSSTPSDGSKSSDDGWGMDSLVGGITGDDSSSSSVILLPSSMGVLPAPDSCSANNMCPHDSPCCSSTGECGTGSACLTGCDPLGSFSTGACMPMAICQNAEYNFSAATQSRILQKGSSWDGGVDKYDFVSDAVGSKDGSLIKEDHLVLSLTETSGTRISSTRSLLYGSVSAVIKASASSGVVSNFILMSGAKDEIDFVFTTNDTNSAQTSYFWLGDTANYTHGSSSQVPPRSEAYHNYTISWMPDELNWLVDGHVIRTVRKSETQDKVIPGRYNYPQTPMRYELSIWGAGANGNGDNFDAFGGAVNWHTPEYMQNGSYSAMVKSMTVSCHDHSSLTYVPANSTAPAASSNLGAAFIGGDSSSGPALASLHLGPGLASPPAWYEAKGASASSAPAPSTTVWWTPEPAVGQGAAPGAAASTSTPAPWMPSRLRERRLHPRQWWGQASSSAVSSGSGLSSGSGVASGSGLSSASGVSSASTTVWWTPESTASPAGGWAGQGQSWNSAASGNDWSGAGAATPWVDPSTRNITSYVYLSNDTFGQIQVGISNASTVISGSSDTGLTAGLNAAAGGGATANVGGILGGWSPDDAPSTTVVWTTVTTTNADGSIATVTSSTMSTIAHGTSTGTSTASPSTMAQRWDNLSTAAHVGVYVGCGAVALLIVAGIGFLWSKAGSSSNHSAASYGGSYQPIGDHGEMIAAGPMASSHGLGPGQSQYDAGASYGMPHGSSAGLYAPPSLPPAPSPEPRFAGGYVPSGQRNLPQYKMVPQ